MGSIKKKGDIIELELPERIPLYLSIHQGFRFSPQNIEVLRGHIETYKPKFILVDPLYQMLMGIDEFKTSEVVETVLAPVKAIRAEFGCSACIVHHVTKHASSTRGGERMYGSQAFHAWSESALHLTKDMDTGVVYIEKEFKSAASGSGTELVFKELDERYEIEVISEQDRENEIIQALIRMGPTGMKDLALDMGLDRKMVEKTMVRMMNNGVITKDGSGKKAVFHPGKVRIELNF